MKSNPKIWVLAALLTGCLQGPYHPVLAQPVDSLSYSLGLLVGKNLLDQGFDKVDMPSLSRGLSDARTEGNALWGPETAAEVIQAWMDGRQRVQYAEVIARAEAFFLENGKRPGVTTLPSGLQYEVIQAGSGPSPGLFDGVKTHYHGTLLNGEVFDSSVDRGEPVSFPVNGVIPGWTEALQRMKVGDKWRLFLPSELAYGASGVGNVIGPFEPLVFEVELLEILPEELPESQD